jgi:hypothetical protein
MDPNTKVLGLMTFKKVWEKKLGKMDHDMKAIIVRAKNMAKAIMYGVMEVYIKGTGTSIKSKAMAPINGLMVVNMLENGMKIKCMVMESTLGQMVEAMKVCTKMI